jgi:glycosyltransferase involved in cell wall biosynthesis
LSRSRPPRVAIVHQGFVPIYRVPFFERLAATSDLEYVVFHGDPPSGTGHRAATGPFAFPNVEVQNRELRAGGRGAVWQPVVRRILRDYSTAVIGAEVKLLANVAVGLGLAATKRPVVLWGQGSEKATHDGAGRLSDWLASLKAAAARRADAYLVYTDGGAQALAAAGVDPAKVTVVRNTIDVSHQIELHSELAAADESALRRELGLAAESVVLVYIGRVYREKNLDELVELARRRADGSGAPRVEIAVIGDGPDLPRVRDLARGVPDIRFVGELYDDREVARWLRAADGLAIPGKVGLAVNHALAHGVPVLTRESDLHAPEVEYLTHGDNGLIVPGTTEDYRAAIEQFATSNELRRTLAEGALRSRESLGLDRMVGAFDHGVRAALDRRSDPFE